MDDLGLRPFLVAVGSFLLTRSVKSCLVTVQFVVLKGGSWMLSDAVFMSSSLTPPSDAVLGIFLPLASSRLTDHLGTVGTGHQGKSPKIVQLILGQLVLGVALGHK